MLEARRLHCLPETSTAHFRFHRRGVSRAHRAALLVVGEGEEREDRAREAMKARELVAGGPEGAEVAWQAKRLPSV